MERFVTLGSAILEHGKRFGSQQSAITAPGGGEVSTAPAEIDPGCLAFDKSNDLYNGG